MAVSLATGCKCSSVYCTTFAYCLNMGGPGYEANHQQHKTLCPLTHVDKCMYMYSFVLNFITRIIHFLYESIICGHCVFKEMYMDPTCIACIGTGRKHVLHSEVCLITIYVSSFPFDLSFFHHSFNTIITFFSWQTNLLSSFMINSHKDNACTREVPIPLTTNDCL